ncbi:unnamed protein product [Linum trigynum]|uniref:Uncharacterized protein n=1 Tax=Linum trigynum TaxID=586398 RepID=A0AAV2DE47_9ROSI
MAFRLPSPFEWEFEEKLTSDLAEEMASADLVKETILRSRIGARSSNQQSLVASGINLIVSRESGSDRTVPTGSCRPALVTKAVIGEDTGRHTSGDGLKPSVEANSSVRQPNGAPVTGVALVRRSGIPWLKLTGNGRPALRTSGKSDCGGKANKPLISWGGKYPNLPVRIPRNEDLFQKLCSDDNHHIDPSPIGVCNQTNKRGAATYLTWDPKLTPITRSINPRGSLVVRTSSAAKLQAPVTGTWVIRYTQFPPLFDKGSSPLFRLSSPIPTFPWSIGGTPASSALEPTANGSYSLQLTEMVQASHDQEENRAGRMTHEAALEDEPLWMGSSHEPFLTVEPQPQRERGPFRVPISRTPKISFGKQGRRGQSRKPAVEHPASKERLDTGSRPAQATRLIPASAAEAPVEGDGGSPVIKKQSERQPVNMAELSTREKDASRRRRIILENDPEDDFEVQAIPIPRPSRPADINQSRKGKKSGLVIGVPSPKPKAAAKKKATLAKGGAPVEGNRGSKPRNGKQGSSRGEQKMEETAGGRPPAAENGKEEGLVAAVEIPGSTAGPKAHFADSNPAGPTAHFADQEPIASEEESVENDERAFELRRREPLKEKKFKRLTHPNRVHQVVQAFENGLSMTEPIENPSTAASISIEHNARAERMRLFRKQEKPRGLRHLFKKEEKTRWIMRFFKKEEKPRGPVHFFKKEEETRGLLRIFKKKEENTRRSRWPRSVMLPEVFCCGFADRQAIAIEKIKLLKKRRRAAAAAGDAARVASLDVNITAALEISATLLGIIEPVLGIFDYTELYREYIPRPRGVRDDRTVWTVVGETAAATIERINEMEMRAKDYVETLMERDAMAQKVEAFIDTEAIPQTRVQPRLHKDGWDKAKEWVDLLHALTLKGSGLDLDVEIMNKSLSILKVKIHQAAEAILAADAQDLALPHYLAAHKGKVCAHKEEKVQADGYKDDKDGLKTTMLEISKLEEEINGKIAAKVGLVKEIAAAAPSLCDGDKKPEESSSSSSLIKNIAVKLGLVKENIVVARDEELQESLIKQFDKAREEFDHLCAALRSKRSSLMNPNRATLKRKEIGIGSQHGCWQPSNKKKLATGVAVQKVKMEMLEDEDQKVKMKML